MSSDDSPVAITTPPATGGVAPGNNLSQGLTIVSVAINSGNPGVSRRVRGSGKMGDLSITMTDRGVKKNVVRSHFPFMKLLPGELPSTFVLGQDLQLLILI
jgi:hypothetical protein